MLSINAKNNAAARLQYRGLAVLCAVAFGLIQASVIFLLIENHVYEGLGRFLPHGNMLLDTIVGNVIILWPPVATMVIYYFLFERKIDQGLAIILAIYSGFCGWALGMAVVVNLFGS